MWAPHHVFSSSKLQPYWTYCSLSMLCFLGWHPPLHRWLPLLGMHFSLYPLLCIGKYLLTLQDSAKGAVPEMLTWPLSPAPSWVFPFFAPPHILCFLLGLHLCCIGIIPPCCLLLKVLSCTVQYGSQYPHVAVCIFKNSVLQLQLTTFQVLNSHMCLGVTIVNSTGIRHFYHHRKTSRLPLV